MGATCGGQEATAGAELDFDSSNGTIDEVRERFVQAGQGHVFNAWNDMDDKERTNLIKECCTFDVNNINDLYANLIVKPQASPANADQELGLDTVEPEHIHTKSDMNEVDRSTYITIGNKLIKEHKAAVVIVAGGMGSRLGFNGPKGKFDIGLPSHKSIFQILAERFFKVQMDAHGVTCDSRVLEDGTVVPVIPPSCLTSTMFIMTSHGNHEETVEHFKENAWFGGQESSFHFFRQQMLPAISTDGKILLKNYSSLLLAPNGNGALFEAIKTNQEVQRGISSFEYVQIIGIDNVLNKILDPIQIGLTHKHELHTTLKACAKRNAGEKVGVIGKKNGHYDIVEYSEIGAELAGTRNPDGDLKFTHGHILIFMIRTDLLVRISKGGNQNSLYHKAFKKFEHCDPETWEDIKPTEPNGWKFELFMHNFMPMIEEGKLGILMVDRATEFAPVKEGDGPKTTAFGYEAEPLPDTPSFSKQMMLAEATQWLAGAQKDGLSVAPESVGKIEVSFLLSQEGENLSWLKRLFRGKSVGGNAGYGYIDHEGTYFELDDIVTE